MATAAPILYTSKRKQKAKYQTWYKDIVCLLKAYVLAAGQNISIPRGETCAELAHLGLVGKIQLHSYMTE